MLNLLPVCSIFLPSSFVCSKRDCGQPCEAHQVHLRDHMGSDHLVLADQGCRNTVFNAQAQSGAHFFNRWRQAGLRHFRVELADESPQVAR